MNLRKSTNIPDWYVLDCPPGVAQPEGSWAEWSALIPALMRRETFRAAKRLAVQFQPNGDAMFYSPRNWDGNESDAVLVPAAKLDAWLDRAVDTLVAATT